MRDLHVCMQQLASIIYALGLACFDHDRKNTFVVFFLVSGSKQVSITGLEDKRQITALLSCTMSGTLLPPQILYQGKTDQCHPNAQFSSDWDIFHPENHWSNEQSMLRFMDTIISPYINETREKLDLALKHPALLIFDCFAAQCVDKFLGKLEQSNFKCVFVPGGAQGSSSRWICPVMHSLKRR